ncbi:potassium-transporting ATPase subunit KdpC [Inconstantimicrobium mannanitabidum]|uniref:Potassium-transporting ATPase KdpC subunit n=1 Tax=Inconstantimicrobium mannanitabidum TaxID=1604901 RepID=A0ACB5RFN1_9CLOT|nr:potassium-transporting ATPase subunit KdpC [Clostridium sp. TW13]GKX67893.1 potassium-transporting ATPase KdpC subunit [Clostridium sp. TW13]
MDYLKKSLKLTLVLILICGLAYPLFITGIGQLIFPSQANGSIVTYNGKVVGSKLIGQQYNDDKHFVGRISAVDYNTSKDGKQVDVTSGSQNLSESSVALKKRVEADINNFLEKNPTVSKKDISSELISQSGSGLDPDITPEGAKMQVDRISKAAGISKDVLYKLIDDNTKNRTLGVLGEKRVNVLELNIGLDKIKK